MQRHQHRDVARKTVVVKVEAMHVQQIDARGGKRAIQGGLVLSSCEQLDVRTELA